MKQTTTQMKSEKLKRLLSKHGYTYQGGVIISRPNPYTRLLFGAAPTLEAAARVLKGRVKDAKYAEELEAITGGK
jgi:ABC-type phosphate/phosphonate transport system ATPase subunit